MIAQITIAVRRSVERVFAGTVARAVDIALPPSCPVTGTRIDNAAALDPAAWAAIQFIDAPFCDHCGVPFSTDYGDGVLCPSCFAAPPAYDRARAAVVYDDASRRLIVGFKHYDRTERADLFGTWLARAGRSVNREDNPIVAPIPLHWRKRMHRLYNQSALLGVRAARALDLTYEPDLLVRTRSTRQQHSLPSTRARWKNVAGAFAIRKGKEVMVDGAHIVLVDDVLTTGATLSAAAHALKKAGAAQVEALVLARVVKGGVGAI